jgi:hypothetical protein
MSDDNVTAEELVVELEEREAKIVQQLAAVKFARERVINSIKPGKVYDTESVGELYLAVEIADNLVDDWNQGHHFLMTILDLKWEPMFFIWAHDSWGSEVHTTKDTLEEAEECARLASIDDPHHEYEVNIEPGGFNNPTYKNGIKIS